MIRRLYCGIVFLLLWGNSSIELFSLFSSVTKLQVTSDSLRQESLRDFVYADMPCNHRVLEQGLSAQELPLQQSISGVRRTKEYEQAAVQQVAFEQAYNNYIFKKSQEPCCALRLSDGPYLFLVLERWNNALKSAQNSGDAELEERFCKRVEALKKTRISSTHAALNSDFESLLIQEFKDAFTITQYLARQYPQNIHVKMALPIIVECADDALKERDIEKAFSLSDFAHDLVALVRGSVKGAKALVSGIYHGAKTTLSFEHCKQMVHGTQNLIKGACKKGIELLDVVTALDSYNEVHAHNVIPAFEQRGAEKYAAFQKHLKNNWQILQKKSWDELLESATEVGTILLLDAIMMNGAGYVATTAGRAFVSEVAMVFKQGGTAREVYCAEVVGVGKLVVEKGEGAVLKAVETVEKSPGKVGTQKSFAQVLKEEVELGAAKKVSVKRDIFETTVIKKDHIFSKKHIADGIYNLGKSEDEIINLFKNIVYELEEKGMLKMGDNQIHTIINGYEVEIKAFFKSNGTVLGFDGFIGFSERRFDNYISLIEKAV